MNAQTQGHHPDAKEHPFTEFNPDGSVKFDFGGDGPVFYEDSKVLILGSFPSKSSEDDDFYYGHPNNMFWGILGTLFDDSNLKCKNKDEKKDFLRDKKIALWDIWAYCYKKDGTKKPSDSLIVPAESQYVDLTELFEKTKIQKIFTTIGGSENKNSKSPRKLNFSKWKIEKWLWDGVKCGDKKYGGYAKYFRHCTNPSEMVTPLYSTSSRGIDTGRVTYEWMLDDYKQIKDFLEKIHAI